MRCELLYPALLGDLDLVTLQWLLLALLVDSTDATFLTVLLSQAVLIVRAKETDDRIEVV